MITAWKQDRVARSATGDLGSCDLREVVNAIFTLMLHRRLAREYDHRPDTSASRVYWASIANMARRLTTPSPAWRDTLGLAA